TGAPRDDQPAVRAAAAGALERHNNPSAIPALRRAMNDSESAVRNAASRAVTALERVARTQPRTRPMPEHDGSPQSDGGRARFYVAVGRPGTRARDISPATLDS